MLDWDDLQTFLAVARHGSLSAAGRALGVQQSTMGRRLAALEARTGAKLLLRTPDGFTPTAVGEAILGNVERIEAETLAVERRITGRDIRLEGLVRLTTIETVANEVLIPAIAAFQLEHPGILIEVVAVTRTLSLTRREADVALRMAQLDQNDLVQRKVGRYAFGVYASEAYLARAGMPDFAAGAPGHVTILNPPETMTLGHMTWFSELTRAATPGLRHSSTYGQRAAAEAGLGLVVLSRLLGDPAKLVRLDTPGPAPMRDMYLAVHSDIRHMPRIRAVTEMIATAIRGAAARLDPG